MSPSSPSSTLPSLRQLAEVVHRGAATWPGSLLLTAAPGEADVAIGTWPIPTEVHHPADPLVGFLAPPHWTVLGLTTTGRAWRAVPGPEGPPEAVRITTLFDRHGEASTILTTAEGGEEAIEEAPGGWVADVVARALGRPTPAPDVSLSAWVEAAWLDRIAELVLDQPGQVRRWAALARLHPLAPTGPARPGVLLAVETRALDLESSWGRMRRLWRSGPPVPAGLAPPGGVPVELPDWFDDGSFSRWVTRDLVPAAELLPAVLDALPDAVGRELVEALVTPPGPAG